MAESRERLSARPVAATAEADGVVPERPPPGARVALRRFERADCSRLVGWIDSPEVLAHWSGSSFDHPPDERALARTLLEESAPPQRRLVFRAEEEERDGAVVGHGELARILPADGTAAVSRVLVAPAERRRGVGEAVVAALAREAFDELGLHRLEVRVFARNVSALRLYRRFGFVPEGTLREAARLGTRYESLAVLSMLEDEWRDRHGSQER